MLLDWLLQKGLKYAVIGGGAVFIMTLFSIKLSVFYIALIIFSVYVGEEGIRNRAIFKEKEEELCALEKFLIDVRHRYYVHQMVDEAVYDTAEACKNVTMRTKAMELYKIITSQDVNTASSQYRTQENNRFLRLFMTLCVVVMEFGDKQIEGHSLFLNNLKSLKDEINMELLQLRALHHRFSGLVIVSVVPVYTVKLIEAWARSNIPELEKFYDGGTGILMRALIFLFTFFAYGMINELKTIREVRVSSHPFIWKLERKPIIRAVLQNYESRYPHKVRLQTKLLQELGELLNFKQLLLKRILYAGIAFLGSLALSIAVSEDYYPFYAFLAVLLFTYAAYFYPLFLLRYRRNIILMSMEDEVIQYQSIIMMLMHVEQMSVLTLLEEIEGFSRLFRQPLRNCINEYPSGDEDALIMLKETCGCEAMEQLADNLLICDEIGIAKAFDEIVPEREYFREKRKQENEFLIERKIIFAKALAFIPLLFTIGAYLIIPFVTESIKMLSTFSGELGG